MDGNSNLNLSRRHFIVTSLTAAGGFAIGMSVLPRLASAGMVAPQPWDNGPDSHELDAWIAIEPDDTVLIRYSRSEMGQGSMTALPMMVAEELQCDWSKVKVEYASPNRNLRENNVYGDMSSNGSHSVRLSHEKMQQVGASAREQLIAAAAKNWGVQPSECKAANSVVTHTASGRTMRYGELAAAAAQIKLDKEPALKTPDQWTFIGKDVPRVDVPVKINGSAQYAMDIRIPDMVFVAINACPVPGGTLKSVDDTPVKGAPGIVQVVKLPNAVAVAATGTFWRAKQALAKLQPEWDFGAGAGTSSEQFAREYRAALDGKGVVARNDGNVDATLPNAPKVIDALYEVPYLAHAPMEPMSATVNLQPDRLDIWVGTQAADGTTKAAANVAGLKPEQVFIHNCFVGGGFGRKGSNDEMIQAILVAKRAEQAGEADLDARGRSAARPLSPPGGGADAGRARRRRHAGGLAHEDGCRLAPAFIGLQQGGKRDRAVCRRRPRHQSLQGGEHAGRMRPQEYAHPGLLLALGWQLPQCLHHRKLRR